MRRRRCVGCTVCPGCHDYGGGSGGGGGGGGGGGIISYEVFDIFSY